MKLASIYWLSVLQLTVTSAIAIETPAQQEVLQFERDACKAFLDADVAALERVLTPGFTLTLSNGEVSTREMKLTSYAAEKSITTSLKTTTC